MQLIGSSVTGPARERVRARVLDVIDRFQGRIQQPIALALGKHHLGAGSRERHDPIGQALLCSQSALPLVCCFEPCAALRAAFEVSGRARVEPERCAVELQK